MKKIAEKIGTDTKYCGSNIFAGSLKDYHFLIKYDSQSSVYTLSFSVEMSNNTTKLTNSIKKEVKDAIVSYNNKNLNIVGSVTNKKYLPEIINPLLNIIGDYLEKNKALEVCRHCKEAKKIYLVDNDSEISFFCNDCYKIIEKSANYKKEKYNKAKENIGLGIIGAILGTIPGIILWILFSLIGIEPGIAGIAITMGSAVFYKKFANNIKLPGIIISSFVGLFMVLVAHEINCAIYIYNLYKADYVIKLMDAYKAIPYYLNTISEFRKIFNNGLLTGYLLSIIGVFTSYSLQRQNANTYEIRKIGEK